MKIEKFSFEVQLDIERQSFIKVHKYTNMQVLVKYSPKTPQWWCVTNQWLSLFQQWNVIAFRNKLRQDYIIILFYKHNSDQDCFKYSWHWPFFDQKLWQLLNYTVINIFIIFQRKSIGPFTGPQKSRSDCISFLQGIGSNQKEKRRDSEDILTKKVVFFITITEKRIESSDILNFWEAFFIMKNAKKYLVVTKN